MNLNREKQLTQYIGKIKVKLKSPGKWHLGFCAEAYTPLQRGFDTFKGRFLGEEEGDEEEKIVRKSGKSEQNKKKKKAESLDLKRKKKARSLRKRKRVRRRMKIRRKRRKKRHRRAAYEEKRRGGRKDEHKSEMYSREAVRLIKTSANNKPLFIYLSMFTKIYPSEVGTVKRKQKEKEELRRENLEELDASISSVVEALRSSGRYNNSVIIFLSDNGARESSEPSLPNHNAPFRGGKGTVYEGGTRIPGFVHSPLVTGRGR